MQANIEHLAAEAEAPQLRPRRLRVVMVVTGFPREENPSNGVFNERAARGLSCLAEVVVVHLRTWLPGRKLRSLAVCNGIRTIQVAMPRMPIGPSLDAAVYARLGWMQLESIFAGSDLIHSVAMDFAGIVASAWAQRAGIRHVVQVTGSDLNAVDGRASSFAGCAAWVHGVACNSDALADEFRQRYPEFRNVRRIWRGVDLGLYQPLGPTAWPQPAAGVKFLYLGGFPGGHNLPYKRNTKGGETLMSAWAGAEAALARPGAQLLMANVAPGDAAVANWRSQLKFPQHVSLLGRLDPHLVPSYLRAADAVLVPSLQEGLPNVAMEASACGRPVLASRVGGLPEVISDHETGMLLPAGDVIAWQNGLIACAAGALDLKATGERARRRMERLFNSENYPPQMLELYKTAMREPLVSH